MQLLYLEHFYAYYILALKTDPLDIENFALDI